MAGLSAAQQSPNDYITQLIASGLGYIPAYQGDEKSAYQRAKKFTGLLDWTPLGIPEAGYQAGGLLGSGAKQRSVGGLLAGAGMTALAAMPLAGRASPLIKEATKGIKAYHGSPHKFDKFDASKIGTGEGAQAFGHGLYFAENPDTATTYRYVDSAIDPNVAAYNGKPIARYYEQAMRAKDAADRRKVSGAEMSKLNAQAGFWEKLMTNWHPHAAIDEARAADFGWPEYTDFANSLDRSKFNVPPAGHMYEVNINADPAQFLDWDKPLIGQSQQVQDFAKSLKVPDSGKRSYVAMKAWQEGRDMGYPVTGSTLHSVASDYGFSGPGQVALSDSLNGAGIPGIKYLDAGSRGATENQTRNFVLFNPDLVDIMRRYAMPVGATGAAAATLPQLFGPQPEMSY